MKYLLAALLSFATAAFNLMLCIVVAAIACLVVLVLCAWCGLWKDVRDEQRKELA
jgi:hypothetical protein